MGRNSQERLGVVAPKGKEGRVAWYSCVRRYKVVSSRILTLPDAALAVTWLGWAGLGWLVSVVRVYSLLVVCCGGGADV